MMLIHALEDILKSLGDLHAYRTKPHLGCETEFPRHHEPAVPKSSAFDSPQVARLTQASWAFENLEPRVGDMSKALDSECTNGHVSRSHSWLEVQSW